MFTIIFGCDINTLRSKYIGVLRPTLVTKSPNLNASIS